MAGLYPPRVILVSVISANASSAFSEAVITASQWHPAGVALRNFRDASILGFMPTSSNGLMLHGHLVSCEELFAVLTQVHSGRCGGIRLTVHQPCPKDAIVGREIHPV
jgi:hypothetical protein